MFLEKVYTVTLDVPDPVTFGAEPERAIWARLRDRFEKTCYGGAYVLQILEIVRRSDCRIRSGDLSGGGYVHVAFRARVSIWTKWEIIPGIVIGGRTPQLTYGVAAREMGGGEATVAMLSSPELEVVRVHQTIPGRVFDTRYQLSLTHATVVAGVLTCDQAARAYSIVGSLTREAARGLLPMVARIRDEQRRRAGLVAGGRRAAVEMFEALLYAYSVPVDVETAAVEAAAAAVGADAPVEGDAPEGTRPALPVVPDPPGTARFDVPAYVEEVAAADSIGGPRSGAVAFPDTVWCRGLEINRSSPDAYAAAGRAAAAIWPTATLENADVVCARFLKYILDTLEGVRGLVGIYAPLDGQSRDGVPAGDIVRGNQNVWTAMARARRPVPHAEAGDLSRASPGPE